MAESIDITAIAQALCQSPILAQLPDAERIAIARNSQLSRFLRRTVLLAIGTIHRFVFFVIDGQIDYCGSTEDGEEITLATFGPGRTSSWMTIFREAPARRDLIGVPHSVILAIPNRVMRAVLDRNPALYPLIFEHEARRFQALLDWQQQSLVSDRGKRLATLLLLIAEISGDNSAQPVVRLTGQRLARTAQCSRQTLSVSLRRLEAAGLIKQAYGRVHILDPCGLRDFAA
jgi:CRP-like cAMP-binding protein